MGPSHSSGKPLSASINKLEPDKFLRLGRAIPLSYFAPEAGDFVYHPAVLGRDVVGVDTKSEPRDGPFDRAVAQGPDAYAVAQRGSTVTPRRTGPGGIGDLPPALEPFEFSVQR